MPHLARVLLGVVGLGVFLNAAIAHAQVRPDRTTNTERLGDCAVRCDIQGGIRSDRNLFHSFKAFSIPRNGEVNFAFPLRIRNLFVRVTGEQETRLRGLLFTTGIANVFLMNPNGILVGENAAINVGGSFTATTADAIAFEDLGVFDTQALGRSTNPQLLSVDPSAFLFHAAPAPIQINAQANGRGRVEVFGNSTLLFLGGEITLDNALLATTGGGSIQLVGIGEAGRVDLAITNPDINDPFARVSLFRLAVPDELTRADVTLVDSQINVRASNQGEMLLLGRNIQLDNSVLLAGISPDLGFRGASAGDIVLSATDSVTIDGFSILANNLSVGALGSSGDVLITASDFTLRGGSQIDTSTFSQGKAGQVVVEVGDRALLQGTTPDGDFASAIISEGNAGSVGDSGNIVVRANELQVLDGAQLSTATESQGDAGNIRLYATDRVVFDGRSADRQYVSIAFSNVNLTGVGDGGNIRIETGDLFLTNGASLVTSTNGIGDAGEIIIRAEGTVTFSGTARVFFDGTLETVSSGIFNRVEDFGVGDGGDTQIWADRLIVADGARVTSASLSSGNAGNITIRAEDAVWVDAARIQTDSSTDLSGRGGAIRIETDQLTLLDGAQIFSSSEGVDRAGDIVLNASRIELDSGAIFAATLSQDGGDLTIRSADLLLLRNNALLATIAGLDREDGGGNGGNIAIASEVILAVPIENSNIAADAFDGNGGNVDIVTQGIFGIEFQERSTPFSDITASSEFGIDGEVTITNPAIDPTSGLIELPTDLVDASSQLRQDCASPANPSPQDVSNSEFIITGRGGLPAVPSDTGSSEAVQAGWVTPPEADAETALENLETGEPESTSASSLVEAQAWAVDNQGQIVLTAQVPVDPAAPSRCAL